MNDGEVREWELDPRSLGIYPSDPAGLRGGSPADNAAALRAVLAGENGVRRDAVLLNAAAALVAAGVADDLGEGLGRRGGGDRLGHGGALVSTHLVAFSRGEPADGAVRGCTRTSRARTGSRRSSAARRRPAIFDRTPTRRRSPARTSGAGAAAVSVLVDERFGGTWDDLRAARAAATLPLLAKGFFSTREHLETARDAGADAALLLLRDLDDARPRELMGVADELGLDTLVEAHDAEELARAVALGAPVIGVNARDLSTFAIDRRCPARRC